MREMNPATPSDRVLSVRSLSLRAGSKELLRDVSFEVAAGEVVCVLGNNGAGKSTLFRVCAGLAWPAAGSVELEGRDVKSIGDAARSRVVGWCPQSLERVSSFTSLQFVSLANELDRFMRGRAGATPAERDFFMECLVLFDAEHLAERDITVLSGGEWKRVQLARLWAQGSRLAILDEPSTGLDLRHVSLLAERIHSTARKRGTGFLVSTHDLGLALAVADRFVFLHRGTILAQGRREDFSESSVFEEVFGVPFRWFEESGEMLTVPLLSWRGDR